MAARERPTTEVVDMETFLVQVWVPADQVSTDTDLRGLVRHIGTGVETPFRGDEEVLRLLRVPGPVCPPEGTKGRTTP